MENNFAMKTNPIMRKIKPPKTRRELVITDFHGTKVADPYQWLDEYMLDEDWIDEDKNKEVKRWMNAQDNCFEEYINSFPIKEDFYNRLTKLWSYETCSVPHKVNGLYYTWRNNGEQKQDVLYRSSSPKEQGEPVLDPNALCMDGKISVKSFAFSPSGKYLAYALFNKNYDWLGQTVHVLDLDTLKTLNDTIVHINFPTFCWLPDDSGFYYTCRPSQKSRKALKTNFSSMVLCLHTLGQKQKKDKLIRQGDMSHRDDPNNNDCWEIIGVVNNTAYIKTAKDAPFSKVISAELTGGNGSNSNNNGDLSNWRTIVPENDGKMLERVILADNKLVCVYLHHASHRIKVYDLNGNYIRKIKLPAKGSVTAVSAREFDSELFIQFSSVLYPGVVLKYDFNTNKMKTVFSPKIDFDFDEYETVQKFCESKDGTKIPMFITRRKDFIKTGQTLVYMCGNGGNGINMTPSFSPATLTWLENGGIYVEVCTRGGNEYGKEWRRGGMLENKQNVFDDFIAAGEYLIRKDYTNTTKLGIYGGMHCSIYGDIPLDMRGGSSGGLLAAACLTQRPELFGAVAIHVPVLDMLNHHWYTGKSGVNEYGNAYDPEQFPFMYAYSPLHNVKANTAYPATLILTLDADDRVVPHQARKFAATLQAANSGDNNIFIRIEDSVDPDSDKPVDEIINEQADLLAFLYINLWGEN